MPEFDYRVALDDKVVAGSMDLATALILAEALFKKYYMEPKLNVSIIRVEKSASEGF